VEVVPCRVSTKPNRSLDGPQLHREDEETDGIEVTWGERVSHIDYYRHRYGTTVNLFTPQNPIPHPFVQTINNASTVSQNTILDYQISKLN
jgi:hypothetical protein